MRVLNGVLVGAAMVLGTVAVTEALVRVLHPTPRTQVLRDFYRTPTVRMFDVHGTPLWYSGGEPWQALRDPPCLSGDPATTRVVAFVGDSLLNVTGTHLASDNFAPVLQARLDATGPGWCVVNLAQFGFSAFQKRAALDDLYARAEVDLAVWEVWGEGPSYTRIGDSLFSIGNHHVGANGVPKLPWLPVPDELNLLLFQRLRSWEYAMLALAVEPTPEDVIPEYRAALAAADAEGARIAFWRFTELNHPLHEPSEVDLPIRDAAAGWLAAQGREIVELRPLLQGQDHDAIRYMDCCHYNPSGHQVLAGLFEAWLRAQPWEDAADGGG